MPALWGLFRVAGTAGGQAEKARVCGFCGKVAAVLPAGHKAAASCSGKAPAASGCLRWAGVASRMLTLNSVGYLGESGTSDAVPSL